MPATLSRIWPASAPARCPASCSAPEQRQRYRVTAQGLAEPAGLAADGVLQHVHTPFQDLARRQLALELVEDRAELGARFADILLDLVGRLAARVIAAVGDADRRRQQQVVALAVDAHRICSRAHSASSRRVRSVRSGTSFSAFRSCRPFKATPRPTSRTTTPTMSAAAQDGTTLLRPRTAAASSMRKPA